jgi:hypothetical protein
MRLLLAISSLFSLFLSACATADHAKLFPSNDEYDSRILDPGTIYGSPYGGFSRATRSRLAALPLRLPDVAIMEDSSDGNVDGTAENGEEADGKIEYFETSDGIGRGYICRVYHEDSLDPASLGDSLFDAPVLSDSSAEEKRKLEKDIENEDVYYEEDDEEDDSLHHISGTTEDEKQHHQDVLLMETSRRLKKLEGVCSQIHLGWWSYEWCYDQSVTQFHIHVDSASSGLELRDVTSLGKFSKRKYDVDLNVDNPDLSPAVNKYAEGEPELSRVTDTYSDGDICDSTGQPRRTTVKYFCCSERLMDKNKGPVLRHGNPLASKIAAIVNLLEDPEAPCVYTINVCTPLLCQDVKGGDDDGLLFDIESESLLPTKNRKKHIKRDDKTSSQRSHYKVKDNESIREVLDRVIGKSCIQSTTTGWWSYEYCHRKHVRQFHESISINIETGMATSGTEDVYMLGFFDEKLDNYGDEDEWKYVANTTLSPGGGAIDAAGSSNAEGNGKEGSLTVAAYFSAEYTGGDVCDDSDVTDSAVKAGGFSSHVIERASSVRYSCGPSFDIYVKEDHTCHYIVEVSVPPLCDHPMFKAPVAKKRVVKCVSLEDSNEWKPVEGNGDGDH